MKYTGERIVPDSNECSDSPLLEEHIERYKFASRAVKNKIVLDVACGTGYGSKILAENGAKKVHGVDISKNAIDYAMQNYRSENIAFIRMDAENLKFSKGFFDVVVSFETIEHLKNQQKFLKNVSRTTKNRGVFIMSTPNRLAFGDTKMPINKFHSKEFDEDELRSELSKHFKKVEILGQREYKECGISANISARTISILLRIDRPKLHRKLLPIMHLRYIGKKTENFSHDYKPYRLDRSRGIPKYLIAVCRNKVRA